MERALLREIGELERSIGELTRRKARRAGAMTSPEWQTPAVRVSRRPDGFSGRQENSTSGPALEAILDLPPAERQNLQALTAALQRQFIQHRSAEASREKLLSRYRCEADVQCYAREAYLEFDAAAQEKLALHAFLQALTPERLRDHAPGRGSDILQLLVPRALRPDVLRLVHGSVGAGHFGNNKTLHRLRGKFHWPGCRHDIELHVHCCDSCTAQKGPNQCSRAPLQQHLVGAPMEQVGVDVLGPFPVTDSGNRYILVAMDYFTKWPEAFAIPDQSAATTAERLVEEMFTRFGAPAELHSDQGRNFESLVLAEVCKRLGVTKTRTTPLHPQSDSLIERFNCTLATQLAILASQHQWDWDRHLPLVLWAYRSAVQESSQLTPASLMFGRELRTPVDLVFGAPPEPEEPSRTREEYYHQLRNRLLVAHDFARKAQASAGFKQKRWYDTRCRGRAFAAGEQVWVYCPERKESLSPKLVPGRGRLVVLHQDRLAPYRPLATPDAATLRYPVSLSPATLR
ncbi:hypothetical protein SKAU_G00015560 [Synaphobranchus kaupii]|uniref:Gypsy retrotransposon integrase-like protein 1 n=1 Tax=Synaphobranchus kaupii TaxID=118154 RepID=A0A9Q1GC07_SYNKA|nr:hypothetical protein SKAU_G00015560 [Synaphobranchus kaupii]